MTVLDVVQISGDRGIAPGSTKGAAQHLRGVAAGLVHRGHRVTTYSPRQPEGPFPAPVKALKELALIDGSGADLADVVVYERYSLGHRGGLDLAQRLGVPFVLEVNAPLVAEAQAHRPGTLAPSDTEVENQLIAAADLVITVSTELSRWIEPLRSGPTRVIANGFEAAWFPNQARPDRAEYPLVFIGHPKPWHGADRLVDFLLALARRGHHPRLLIIGGGPGADSLRAHARRAGVGSQVTITGALPPEEASALLTNAGIGLAPYRRQDPFYFCPLKIVDYLAAGVPVVSTDQGDIAEMVGDAGVVVDADDDEGFVAAIAQLLDDPAARAHMGRVGRSSAMSTMTWDHVAERTEAEVLSILGVGVGA